MRQPKSGAARAVRSLGKVTYVRRRVTTSREAERQLRRTTTRTNREVGREERLPARRATPAGRKSAQLVSGSAFASWAAAQDDAFVRWRVVVTSVLAACLVAAVFFAATEGKAHSGGASTAVGRVDPHVAAGAHDFVQFACSACHGNLGRGGVSPSVPALNVVGKSLTVKALTTIITHGLGESANPKRPYMPVWGPVISKQQVADLVAYIRAGLPRVQYATPVPFPGNQGAVVAGPPPTFTTGASTATARTRLGVSPTHCRRTNRSRRSRDRTSGRSSTPTRRSST